MKILIVRFSSIGDIVLTTPVIRALKTQLDADVHYATKAQYKAILDENPYITKVHCLQQGVQALIKELREEKFDALVDLHNNLRTLIIKTSLGIESYSFRKLNFKKWLMVNFKINRLPVLHIVDRYLASVAELGIKNDALGLDYFIPDRDVVPLEWLPEIHRPGYGVYAIGGQHATKKLPFERMVELCKKIDRPLVLLGDAKDKVVGEQLIQHFISETGEGSKNFIYNGCGLYNLNQSASILKRAQFVFTHDSGLMHIAAAFKKEIFSIWGNTIPAFGMTPYRTRFFVLENNSLSCRPCSKIGFEKCPKGHFRCMKEVPLDFYLP